MNSDGRSDSSNLEPVGLMITNIRYQSMRRYTFVDINDVEVGSLEDLVLNPKDLSATHLLLGAGFFEEYMEEVGKRPNIDEIVEITKMDVIEDHVIQIHEKIDELQTTNENGEIPFDSILFSELITKSITINGTESDIEIDDYLIDTTPKLVIQLPSVQQALSMKGFRQKFEFLVPISNFTYSESINLTLDEQTLVDKIEQTGEYKMTGKTIIDV
ncbi:MAG: hypothetical protein INQ03_04830 [Candidatus Heimdallarchaeota archaeon]|nr:hypothetical protein [Candidatus Heimdallarchaeota archaeon]